MIQYEQKGGILYTLIPCVIMLSGVSMEKYIKLLEEAKTSENGALVHILILTILLIIVDVLHLFIGFNFPLWLRPIYTTLAIICYYVLINRYYRNKRIKRENAQYLEQQKEIHKQKIQNYSKVAIPAFNTLTGLQKTILFQFVEEKTLTTIVYPGVFNQLPLNEIISINNILSNVGLNIEILTTIPHLVIRIDKIFYDLLTIYYGNKAQE